MPSRLLQVSSTAALTVVAISVVVPWRATVAVTVSCASAEASITSRNGRDFPVFNHHCGIGNLLKRRERSGCSDHVAWHRAIILREALAARNRRCKFLTNCYSFRHRDSRNMPLTHVDWFIIAGY